jgi:hypothetical protein
MEATAAGVAPVLECLPGKALSLNSRTAKKKDIAAEIQKAKSECAQRLSKLVR